MLKYSLPALLRAACAGLQPASRDVNSRRLRVLLGSLSCFFIINKIADFILRVSAKCSLAIYHMLQTPDVCSTVTKSDGFCIWIQRDEQDQKCAMFPSSVKVDAKGNNEPAELETSAESCSSPSVCFLSVG